MAECCSEWIAEEFKSVDFGDERLFARFQLTAQRLSNSPQGNIGEACAGSAETKGAYRMFANDAINPRYSSEKISLARRYIPTAPRIENKKHKPKIEYSIESPVNDEVIASKYGIKTGIE